MHKLSAGIGSGVGWGSLAATVTLILQIPLLDNDALTSELLLLIPLTLVTLLVSYILMLVATLIMGLPTMALLAAIECDEAEVATLAGAAAGFGVILAIAIANDSALDRFSAAIALSALVGGGVTGGTWAGVREKISKGQWPAPANSHRQSDQRWLR